MSQQFFRNLGAAIGDAGTNRANEATLLKMLQLFLNMKYQYVVYIVQTHFILYDENWLYRSQNPSVVMSCTTSD